MSSVRTIKRNLNLKRWAAIIADRNTTDLTVDEYCKRNNLSRHSYFYWLRLLRQESAGIGTNDSVPVDATTEATSIVELVPSGKKDILVPVVIPGEDKTAKDDESIENYGYTVQIEWDYTQERPYKGDVIKDKRRIYIHYFYSIEKGAEDEQAFDKHIAGLCRELLEDKPVESHKKAYE